MSRVPRGLVRGQSLSKAEHFCIPDIQLCLQFCTWRFCVCRKDSRPATLTDASGQCMPSSSVYIQIRHRSLLPPIYAVSSHVATDKDPSKFRSIFSDNLQPIATPGKKARGTLLVDKHCGNGCSIKRAPLAVSYYNEISGGHIGRAVVRTRCSASPVLPLWLFQLKSLET